jgi:hypothetical protein
MKDKKNNQILKNFIIGGLSGMTATSIVSYQISNSLLDLKIF